MKLKVQFILWVSCFFTSIQAEKTVTCMGKSEILLCDPGTVINVDSSFYGRENTQTCPHQHVAITNCYAKTEEQVVAKCNCKSTCSLKASDSFFNVDPPCGSTRSYLQIEYSCSAPGGNTCSLDANPAPSGGDQAAKSVVITVVTKLLLIVGALI